MSLPVFAPRRPWLGSSTGSGFPGALASRTSLDRGREATALLLFAAALFSALALASFAADPARADVHGADWVGPAGAALAHLLVGSVGFVAWCIPAELALLATPLFRNRASIATVARIAGDFVVALILAALLHVAASDAVLFGAMPAGGAFGELFGEVLRSMFSTVGSYLIGLTVIGLILIGRASFSFIGTAQKAGHGTTAAAAKAARGAKAVADAWSQARAIEKARAAELRSQAGPRIDTERTDAAIIAVLAEDDADDELGSPAASSVLRLADDRARTPDPAGGRANALGDEEDDDGLFEHPVPITPTLDTPARVAPARRAAATPVEAPEDADADGEDAGVPDADHEPETARDDGAAEEGAALDAEPASPEQPPVRKPRQKKVDDGPVIVDTSAQMAVRKAARQLPLPIHAGFRLPSTDLLDAAPPKVTGPDGDTYLRNAKLLEKTLADYGVQGTVEEIHPGPTVTTYEVSPAAGTKVSKVASLADDLALGLSRTVRIIAPIPGKNRIGFEIPNDQRSPVSLRELVEDDRFQRLPAPLPVVLGRDQVGAPYFADLASMPHVIVAGATGAGKSVGLNVMLTSLLYRKTPEELRLLMIDPKVVELAPFDGIPHMLLPVVTDMKQAANALKWAVDEMERRYQLFATAGTKNIHTYNGWVDRVHKGEAKPPPPPKQVSARSADGDEITVDAAKDGSDVALPEKLASIVIVVDEFADLMMQQGKDVEAAVARLAQKARAAGMHVILATQRPSVDVITGMIKANFPTRIAFRVAQKVDSRTILDEQGAEHLLGRGDMLVKMNGTNDMRRVQCPFVSEDEVQRVTDFLRTQGSPVYDENILKPRDEEGGEDGEDDEALDAMYDAAVRVVADTRRCSTSWLQRKLNLGYNRAARIVEAMEKRGVVGPPNGAREREVLISTL